MVDHDAKQGASAWLGRLVALAPPGGVLVSAAAAALLERRFDLEPAPTPEPAYRLAGGERTGLNFAGRMAPFVGRRQELELLAARLETARGGQGQVVAIIGEPGIGKSRLLFEFRRGLAPRQARYLEGRCVSYGSAIPSLPLLDMLRSTSDVTDADTPDAIATKVRRTLEALGFDAAEGVPYLLRLLGVKEGAEALGPLSPEAVQSRTFEILRRMTFQSARQRPLVLAVEDLQWIDETSGAFLGSLVEPLASAPILLVVTYRPGHRVPWLARSAVTQIALAPLPPEDGLRMAQALLESAALSPEVAAAIVAKAEGNPFFLEELALAAIHHPGGLTVPDTIQEVLMARIGGLPEEPRLLLQTASVLGREAPRRWLEAVWDRPGGPDPHVGELIRREFLVEQSGGDEPVYVFRHALHREVAYASLPPARRRALHAVAGQTLERLFRDRLDEVDDRLAHHYARSDEAAKAVEYLTRFAERAARAWAHAEAIAACREALTHVDRLPATERDHRRLALVLRQAASLYFVGRFEEIRDVLLGERERVEALGDAALRSAWSFWVSRTWSVLGHREAARESARRALEEAARSGDEAALGRAHYALAYEAHWAGELGRSVEHGRLAVGYLQRTGERWLLAQAYWIIAVSHMVLGDFAPALEAAAQVGAIGEAIGDPRLKSSAAWTAGGIQALRGEWEAGIAACQRAVELSPNPVNTTVALAFLGGAYLDKGDIARATEALERAVEQLGRFHMRQTHGWVRTMLADAYRLAGRLDEARRLATEALEITRQTQHGYGVALAQRALGRIAEVAGSPGEAETHLREALGGFRALDSRVEVARTLLALAKLARRQGRPVAALDHLEEADRLLASLDLPRYRAEVAALAADLGSGR